MFSSFSPRAVESGLLPVLLVGLIASADPSASRLEAQSTTENLRNVRRPSMEQITDDGRWNQTELGRYLASVISLPEGPVRKGLSIRVGDTANVTMCYDTEFLSLRAIWSGGFLKFDPARFGIINNPTIDGKLLLSSREAPGWQTDDIQYLGMYVSGDRVVLRYRVDGIEIHESPWASRSEQRPKESTRVKRDPDDPTAEIDAPPQPPALDDKDALRITRSLVIAPHEKPLVIHTNFHAQPHITIPPSDQPQEIEIVYIAQPSPEGLERIEQSGQSSVDVLALIGGGPSRWPEPVVVRGEVAAEDSAPYVIDKVTLPHDNPYRALMFVGGHGFFSGANEEGVDGDVLKTEVPSPDMAVCTLHGEVWTVSGVDENLDRLQWRRFATGLFQPLGMVVVNDLVHVLGRDQITRLHDINRDGEADYYENFCNQYPTSANRHDFVTSLERDAAGNFYFAHGVTGVMQVSPDGRTCRTLATGLRNPNGLGASPDGTVTVAPQQGNWTPSSCIFQVREGDYYGYGGPRAGPRRPLGYDPPLCWIPHTQDSSSGSQVWVTSNRWGPLAGQMLHLSYGQCTLMLTLRESVGDIWQGGNVEFPLFFDSGVMRGRFSPLDGQLYVSGLRGWQNRAVLDGCLARVRFTGQPLDMPVAVKTTQNGLAVTFARPLDPNAAQDATNFAIQRWNYHWRRDYGSPDYSVRRPGVEGRDDVPVRSATLLDDRRTLFLEISDMRPADQYLVRYSIAANDGRPIEQYFSYTIRAVGADRLDESLLNRQQRVPAMDAELEKNLAQGLILRFEQASGTGLHRDVRTGRLAAWYVDESAPPTPRLEPMPFRLSAEGFLLMRQPGNYRFSLRGSGTATLAIDGKELLSSTLSLEEGPAAAIRLGTGLHALEIRYASPPTGNAALRLLWAGPDFLWEPIPPELLRHDATDKQLQTANQLYLGRELFMTVRCRSCHDVDLSGQGLAADEHSIAPDLRRVGERLQTEWVAASIADPSLYRDDARMPAVLTSGSERERQRDADDLAAFLALQTGAAAPQPPGSAATPNQPTATAASLVDVGERLYEQLSCLACHRFSQPRDGDPYDRVSLHYVAAKYRGGALAAYLRQPHAQHPGTTMPDFALSELEADALQAYLRREAQGSVDPNTSNQADSDRGQRLYSTLGCANCHPLEGRPRRAAPPLNLTSQTHALAGCLATSPADRPDAPDFGFTSHERDALARFLGSDGRSLTRAAPLESAAQLVRQLRCNACHDRDGRFAPRAILSADEGSTGLAPEPLPSLTWTGEQLRSEWIADFIAGHGVSPRPWLTARMPRYPLHAATLAQGLPAEHGMAGAPSKPAPPVDDSLADIGRQLTFETALDCRQCHAMGDLPPRGDDRTLNAPGINFALVEERLRPDFFLRLLRDPLRVDPRTKMPQLSENGRTKVTRFFAGDAEQQFAAIWEYIRALDRNQIHSQ